MSFGFTALKERKKDFTFALTITGGVGLNDGFVMEM